MTTAVPGMTAEYEAGSWAADDLLTWVVANKDSFWWQSHTLSHLARDNLGTSDCEIEDSGRPLFPYSTCALCKREERGAEVWRWILYVQRAELVQRVELSSQSHVRFQTGGRGWGGGLRLFFLSVCTCTLTYS